MVENKQETIKPEAKKVIDPTKVKGNYVILTEPEEGPRRAFTVFNGTVKVIDVNALSGAFELK